MHIQDLHVTICKIVPILDRESTKHMDCHIPPCAVTFRVVQETIGCRSNLSETTE